MHIKLLVILYIHITGEDTLTVIGNELSEDEDHGDDDDEEEELDDRGDLISQHEDRIDCEIAEESTERTEGNQINIKSNTKKMISRGKGKQGPEKKTPWEPKEIEILKKGFSQNILSLRAPRYNDVKRVQNKFPELKTRSVVQIKSRVWHIIQMHKKQSNLLKLKSAQRLNIPI